MMWIPIPTGEGEHSEIASKADRQVSRQTDNQPGRHASKPGRQTVKLARQTARQTFNLARQTATQFSRRFASPAG